MIRPGRCAGGHFEIGPELRIYTLSAQTDSSPALPYWVGARF